MLSPIFICFIIFMNVHQFTNVCWNSVISNSFSIKNGVSLGKILMGFVYCYYCHDLIVLSRSVAMAAGSMVSSPAHTASASFRPWKALYQLFQKPKLWHWACQMVWLLWSFFYENSCLTTNIGHHRHLKTNVPLPCVLESIIFSIVWLQILDDAQTISIDLKMVECDYFSHIYHYLIIVIFLICTAEYVFVYWIKWLICDSLPFTVTTPLPRPSHRWDSRYFAN